MELCGWCLSLDIVLGWSVSGVRGLYIYELRCFSRWMCWQILGCSVTNQMRFERLILYQSGIVVKSVDLFVYMGVVFCTYIDIFP